MTVTQETLVKNGIKIIQISASYDRKVSDGQYGSMGGFFSMTADVEPVASVDDQMDMLFNFVKDAAAKHLRPEFNKTKAELAARTEEAINPEKSISPEVPTAVSPSVTAAKPAAPVIAAAKPAAQVVATPGKDVKIIHAVKMENAPRKDSKTDLKFYEAGHKYPDLTVTRTPETFVKMLQDHFSGPVDFSQVWEIDFDCDVEYVDSDKLNTNGNPYKDMQRIVPKYQQD